MDVCDTLEQTALTTASLFSLQANPGLLQAASGPASWQAQLPFVGRPVHHCTPSLNPGPAIETLAERFKALSGDDYTFAFLQQSSLHLPLNNISVVSMQNSSAVCWAQAWPSPRRCRTVSRRLSSTSSRSLAATILMRTSRTQVRHALNCDCGPVIAMHSHEEGHEFCDFK